MSNRILLLALGLLVLGLGVWIWSVARDEGGPDLDGGGGVAAEDREGERGAARRRDAANASGDSPTTADSDGSKPKVTPAEGGAEVRLRVLDQDGEPLGGVPVELRFRRGSALRRASEGDRRRATSSAQGEVIFRSLDAPTRVEVVVRAPQFSDQVLTGRTSEDERLDLGDVTLSLGADLSGTVYGVDGAPATGIKVLAWSRDTKVAGSGLAARAAALRLGARDDDARAATTDAEGRYRIRGLTPGVALVRVRPTQKPERERRDLQIAMGETLRGVDFRLIEGWTLRGVVTQKDEVPVGKAEIRLTPEREGAALGAMLNLGGGPDAITDSQGNFAAPGLDPELRYRVAVSARGFVDRERVRAPERAEGEAGGFAIVLDPAPYVEVRVTADEGAPFAGSFTINCEPGRPGGSQRPVAFYGQDAAELLGLAEEPGLAFIGDVRTGRLRFRVTAEGRATATMSLRGLRSGDRKVVTVPLPPAINLAGRVVDDEGTPVAGAEISAVRPARRRGEFDEADATPGGARGGGILGKVKSDAEGRFRLEAIPAGAVVVRARHRRYVSVGAEELDLADSREDLELRLDRTALLSGVVRDVDGTTLAKARVLLMPLGEDGRPTGFRGANRRTVTADRDGRYRIERLRPGRYRVVPRVPGQGMRSGLMPGMKELLRGEDKSGVEVALAIAEERTLDLRLAPSPSIRGQVTRAGQPVVGVTLSLAAAPREGLPEGLAGNLGSRQVRTDEEGRFQFRDVQTGPRRVTLKIPGSPQSMTRDLDVQGTTVHTADFELPGGAVSGRITDATTGAPIAGVEVKLRVPGSDSAEAANPRGLGRSGLAELMGTVRAPRTNAEGVYRIDHVAAGSYELVIAARGYEDPAPRALRVADSLVDRVDAELTRAPVLELRVTQAGSRPAGTFPVAAVRVLDAQGEVRARRMVGIGRTVEITDLPEGEVRVDVKLGERRVERGVTLVRGETTTLNVTID